MQVWLWEECTHKQWGTNAWSVCVHPNLFKNQGQVIYLLKLLKSPWEVRKLAKLEDLSFPLHLNPNVVCHEISQSKYGNPYSFSCICVLIAYICASFTQSHLHFIIRSKCGFVWCNSFPFVWSEISVLARRYVYLSAMIDHLRRSYSSLG